jgi:hypothetical protein
MKKSPKKILKENANKQGGLTVPLPPKTAYGTGLPDTKIAKAKQKQKH